jgi:hypothetical protein
LHLQGSVHIRGKNKETNMEQGNIEGLTYRLYLYSKIKDEEEPIRDVLVFSSSPSPCLDGRLALLQPKVWALVLLGDLHGSAAWFWKSLLGWSGFMWMENRDNDGGVVFQVGE